ncbi:hypothetical protein BDP27DRAFT_1406182 [Rhodocollybia butyracea]|uniref:Uncharacterized protein n=1 Tax=Rhodocollybia butyracea TaxID=206335 RepID=A0A9P5U163_9AGAR|nr:hypothetical protein BDP27DRAFT_1406182 [Rhodocollybia butyracea]
MERRGVLTMRELAVAQGAGAAVAATNDLAASAFNQYDICYKRTLALPDSAGSATTGSAAAENVVKAKPTSKLLIGYLCPLLETRGGEALGVGKRGVWGWTWA